MMFQDPAWDYKKFNFDGDMKKVDDKMGPVFNAVDPNLEKFRSRGGKLVMYHGWSDAAISPVNSVNYCNSVVAKMGKQARRASSSNCIWCRGCSIAVAVRG